MKSMRFDAPGRIGNFRRLTQLDRQLTAHGRFERARSARRRQPPRMSRGVWGAARPPQGVGQPSPRRC